MAKNTIAYRTFNVTGTKLKVKVCLSQPVADGNDFRCDYTINWPSNVYLGHALGIDGMQAIILALKKIGADINCSEFAKQGSLVWLEPGKGYGLPLSPGLEDMYVGDDPP